MASQLTASNIKKKITALQSPARQLSGSSQAQVYGGHLFCLPPHPPYSLLKHLCRHQREQHHV
jgi:hypothetical protein